MLSPDYERIDRLEPVFLFAIRIFFMVDLAQEHCFRTDPERAVAVELAINDIFLPRLAVLRNILNEIIISLNTRIC